MNSGSKLKRVRQPNCENCPFKGRTAGHRGNPKARIAIVGESPGITELREGIPFVGDSGKVLQHAIPDSLNIDEDFYITNALSCHPKRKEADIMSKAVRACKSRLYTELQAYPRDIIIALGNPAVHSLTGNSTFKITQIRGRPLVSPLAKYGIMPIVHPAALLRGTGSHRQFREDILYATELAKGAPPREPIEADFKVYDTKESLRLLVKRFSKATYIAADVETTGFDRRHDKILCLGMAIDPRHVVIVPGELVPYLKKLFEAHVPSWIWHNGKFDTAFLHELGLPARTDEDTMLLSYALDEQGGIHDLEQVAGDLIGAPNYKHMIKPFLPNKDSSYALIPKPILYDYLHYDVTNTLQIFHKLRPRVTRDHNLEKLYTELLIPGSNMLREVEAQGLYVNNKQLNKNDKRLGTIVEELRVKISELAGYDINPNSPQQVATHLYQELKLKTRHRNTTKETLERLPQIPIIRAILTYRRASKAYSTYVKGIRNTTDTSHNRVHTSFLLHGTRTGRLSSKGPNVQNVPRDPLLRSMYMAPRGYVLIEVDLNQAELRSLAALSNDEFLCDIYNSTNRSLHTEVAIKLFGEDYTDEEKMRAKALNFGIVYGREAPSLAQEFRISVAEGQMMIDGWFEAAPQAYQFIQKCRAAPTKLQTITTIFGRKKRHHLITRKNIKGLRNEASNFPHQSIASDINLEAAILVRPKLVKLGAHIVNLIHDSTLIECPHNPTTIKEVIRLTIAEMEAVPYRRGGVLRRVPFKAEAEIGKRWGYLEEYEEAA